MSISGVQSFAPRQDLGAAAVVVRKRRALLRRGHLRLVEPLQARTYYSYINLA